MAAQLLANCMAGEAASATLGQENTAGWLATDPTVPPTPTPTLRPTHPEMAASATMASSATSAAAGSPCSDWGRVAKLKEAGPSEGCTVPVVASQPSSGYALSLPLHPERALQPNLVASGASLVPPPPTLPASGRLMQETPPSSPPQVSRVLQPQAVSQPNWANQPRPVSGSQMYQFRLASLRAGELYTRATPQRYINQWRSPAASPSHPDWQALLQREAAVMAQAQGRNRLTVVVGDSLALWLPPEALPRDRFWLNQSISGETTAHMLRRLHYFANTRPDTIHLMAGINDLKNGASEAEVTRNISQMLTRLRQQHPQANIIVYSILPTRWSSLPSDRIGRVNAQLATLAQRQGATFADLNPAFIDGQGQLRRELTTDGLHLSRQGYEVWQATLLSY